MNRVLYSSPANPLVVEYFRGQKYFGWTVLHGVPFPAYSKALMALNLYIEHEHYIVYNDTNRCIRGEKESQSCRDNDEAKQIPSTKR